MIEWVSISYRRTHRDNLPRNLSVHHYNQDRNDHIQNQHTCRGEASSPACSLQGLMRSLLWVDSCLLSWQRCKGRCKVFCSCVYNTRFWTPERNLVPPIQLVRQPTSLWHLVPYTNYCDTASFALLRLHRHSLESPDRCNQYFLHHQRYVQSL